MLSEHWRYCKILGNFISGRHWWYWSVLHVNNTTSLLIVLERKILLVYMGADRTFAISVKLFSIRQT